MGFLVGNDFIPHLPNFHIATNALPFLYQTYIHVLPKLDGYINENGLMNLNRFQSYLEALYDVSITPSQIFTARLQFFNTSLYSKTIQQQFYKT